MPRIHSGKSRYYCSSFPLVARMIAQARPSFTTWRGSAEQGGTRRTGGRGETSNERSKNSSSMNAQVVRAQDTLTSRLHDTRQRGVTSRVFAGREPNSPRTAIPTKNNRFNSPLGITGIDIHLPYRAGPTDAERLPKPTTAAQRGHVGATGSNLHYREPKNE